jgi:glycosyltransferase involved in cell wall biosynthesis
MPLRILHVLRTGRPDADRSAESICELAGGQSRLGHEVEVVTFSEGGAVALEQTGVPVHRLPRGIGSYGLSRTFVRWLGTNAARYDCVIVHGIWSFSALGTWWALRDSKTPFFIFTHGNLDPWFKHSRPLRHLASWLYWPWGVYPVLRDAHAVFFVCDNERQRARETFWLYDCHEFVVRTGSAETPREQTFSGPFLAKHPGLWGRRIFLYVADHDPDHGIRTLLGAVERLAGKGSWDRGSMTLVITGTDDEATREAAKRAERLGIGQSVFCAGQLDGDEFWDALGSAEATLRPSSSEVCARRVAESLSAGTPVLMSTGSAVWKDVVNSGAGLADDSDAEGIARILERWIALPESEKLSMRELARRCYEERYSLEGAAHTLTSAIYLLVGVHRDGRWDQKPLKPASELV